ncbi:MAG: SpoIIE family protein phosphatase [Sphingobacteriaceae bacterium]|nr:SpoIIE family protein phosphatase [Sphingobacteriaceae bacterium]
MKIRCSLIYALLFFSVILKAQYTRFKKITTDNGLPNISVNAIAQDRNGFIWFGTSGGLAKWDGYKITSFVPEIDSINEAAFHVNCLLATPNDKLWVGFSAGGLFCIDLKTYAINYFMPDSINDNSVSSEVIKELKLIDQNKMAISTSAGLDLLDMNTMQFTHYRHEEGNKASLMSNSIRSIELDKEGHLWLSHFNKGITCLDLQQGKIKEITIGKEKGQLHTGSIRDMMMDKDGYLWISLWQAGICRLNVKTGEIEDNTGIGTQIPGLEKVSLVFDMYEDPDGKIWFATAENGITRYDKKTLDRINLKNNPDDPNSLGDNTAMKIFIDKYGVLFTGTWRNGVNYFDTRSLLLGHFKHQSDNPHSLHSNHITTICQLNKEAVLLGTAAGISKMNLKTRTFELFDPVKNGKKLATNSTVTDIKKDQDDNLWIGTNGGGLFKYIEKENRYVNYIQANDSNSLKGDTPDEILVDNAQNIWVSMIKNGLFILYPKSGKFRKVKFTGINISDNDLKIFQMIKDSKGNVWIATQFHGLIKYNPKRNIFSQPLNIVNKQGLGLGVSSIAIDKKGMFWLGTSEGLIQFNPESEIFENYSEEIPYLKTAVLGLLIDLDENLWLGTLNGICKFNPKLKSFSLYNVSDGLQGKEFYSNSTSKLPNGSLMFGGLNGLNYFNPAELTKTKAAPTICFTDFSVQNKPFALPQHVSVIKEINLSYRDYFFSVSFVATDYTDPNLNEFNYKLEGFNKDWVEIGNVHAVTFTNLDPGTYRLLVKAGNSNGTWAEEPAELIIHIAPPFWRTNWFYTLCIITIISSFYGFIKYREKKLIVAKKILEQKVDERTEELNEEKLKVEEAHRDIKDSILYAQRIQQAILFPELELLNIVPESFIFFLPKDIVSGDFYWMIHVQDTQLNKNILAIAAADCTGHGVPGAFMSMLNNTLLNQTAYNPEINTPADALNFLNRELPKNLKSTDKENSIKDGMDISFCLINFNTNTLLFAGANNPCWIIRNGNLIELKGTKQAITASEEYAKKTFADQKFELEKGDCIYLFTDGFADQFGGPKGKKFKYKTLANLLLQNNDKSIKEQKQNLQKAFYDWKGDLEQVDDICLIGIRI